MNNLKAGLIAGLVLILVIGACGCTSTNTSNPTPTAAPTVAPIVTTTPTAKPTATPVVSTDSNIRGLEAHWLSRGYVIDTHFVKTTVDGKTAYKGTVTDSDGTYKVTDILTSTETEAASYADTLEAQYIAKGFTIQSDNGNHQYVVLNGSNKVSISGYSVVYGTTSPGVGVVEKA